MEERTYLLAADWVYGWGDGRPEMMANGVVWVENGRILAVNPTHPPTHLPRIRLEGQLLLPGLISGHTHVAGGTPTRGIIEGGRSFARPLLLVEQLDDDELDALTAYNLAEIVRGGCTTQVEMSLSPRQAASYVRVAARWGVRGFVGAMIPSIDRLFPIWFREDDQQLYESVAGTMGEIEGAITFAEGVTGLANPLLRPMLAPHATDTHTPETMRAIGDGARRLDCGLHIHLAQSPREAVAVQRLWGMRPAEWCESLGLLERPFVGAHMVGLDWIHEAPLLARHGAIYSHCPSGGGAGGATQPYPEALGAGVVTNIGIDTHSNDMVENVKLAVLYGQAREHLLRERSGLPLRKPTIHDALAGVTHQMGDGLGRPDLGRIAPGAVADFTAVNVTNWLVGVGATPPEPLHHLLYANGLSVSQVVVNGRFLLRDGVLTWPDVAEVQARGTAVVRKLWRQLAAENWFKA